MEILNRLISLAPESNNSVIESEADDSFAVGRDSSSKTSVFSQLGAIQFFIDNKVLSKCLFKEGL